MDYTAERGHWLAAFTGVLDAAFRLSEEEQFYTLDILNQLFDKLGVPERGKPRALPSPVALEVACAHYSTQMTGPRSSAIPRAVRAVSGGDIVASVETWREAFFQMILTAYPDLEPLERVVTLKVLSDLLVAIGVPDRAAYHFPDEVIRAYQVLP